MKKITLTRGEVAVVDNIDFPIVAGLKWHLRVYAGRFKYAGHTFRENGKVISVAMHRLIMDAKPGEIVDHRDHNGLNNRKRNLRKCTRQENARHRVGSNSNSKSGIRGVFWCTTWRRWIAAYDINGKRYYAGRFTNKKKAANALRLARNEAFGSFAGLASIKNIGAAKEHRVNS